jgi:hypothetical protein
MEYECLLSPEGCPRAPLPRIELARGPLLRGFMELDRLGRPKLGGLGLLVEPELTAVPMELCKKEGEGSPAGVKEGADDGGGGPAGVVLGCSPVKEKKALGAPRWLRCGVAGELGSGSLNIVAATGMLFRLRFLAGNYWFCEHSAQSSLPKPAVSHQRLHVQDQGGIRGSNRSC